MTSSATDTLSIVPIFRPKSSAKPKPNPLAQSAVVQYFVGAYLGTRHGLGYGYPTHKYAQGYDWSAQLDGDRLTVTRAVSCLDRSAIETSMRDLHTEHDRLADKIRTLTLTIQEFERAIAQAESRIAMADDIEADYLKVTRDQYYATLSEYVQWREAPEKALQEILLKMRELASKGHAEPESITVDLGEYV